jgi:hypothetical protein
MKNMKKVLAVALSVLLILSVMPFAAFAADVDSYQSLVDEVAAFNAGDADVTITLTADVELQNTITIDTANGKTLTINGGKNITLASGVGSAFYVKQGSLNLGKNTITGAPSNYKLIYLTGSTNPQDANYSNVTIDGATINCTNGYAVMISANGNAAYGANITTKSGSNVYGYYGALYVNGNVKANAGENIANVTVSGGTLTSTEDKGTAIYGAGYANYTIKSGTLTAATAAYFKAGNVTISGGTFNATGAQKAYSPNGNGYEPTGEAVVLEANSGYAPVTSVSIKGGTFNSANADPIGTYANDTSVTAPDNFITGGTFKSAGAAADVSEYFADVAEVNGVKYKSFEDALAAISNVSTAKHSKAKDPNYDYKTYVANGTIKLLADTTSNGIIIGSGSNLVVDFNGKTLDINAKPVGSNGTESSALQLLKNSDITFKDGTLTSSYAYSATDTEYIQRLIQNYSNLTLDNMNVTMTGNFRKAITISTCNGDFVVNNSTVSAPDFSAYGYTTAMAAEQLGAEAFTLGTFSSYTAATATVQGDSTINGNVSVDVTNPDVSTNTLTLKGGTLNGDIVMKDNANSEGVEITKANTFTQEAPEGYKWVDNGDGTSTIAEVNYVAQIGSTKYETLEEAFAAAQDGDTITVLADCAGNGIKVPQGKFATGLTVDFGGHTYTVDGTTVGSTGTETQGFQLLKNNNITFQNGKIYGDSTATATLMFLIQNYSNLTLDNMELQLIGRYYNQYTLSNNNGDIVINDSTINAPDFSRLGYDDPAVLGCYAFDVCRYASYPSVSVTVTGNSVINGSVEVSASNNDAKNGLALNLNGGTLTGNIVLDESAKAAIDANPEKAAVKKAVSFKQEAPEGYEWVLDNGAQILAKKAEPVNGGSLTLDDGVKFNAYLDADAYGVDVNEAIVKITYNANSDLNNKTVNVVTETKALSTVEKYVDETSPYNGTYKFTLAQAPAQMNEDIVIELYANADETGPVASITTSAAELCKAVIASEETSQDYKDLCASLLDYGRAAQIYFSYDLENLAAAYNNAQVTTLGYADMRTTAAALNGVPFKGVSFTVLSTTEWNIAVREAQTVDTITGVPGASASATVLHDKSDAIKVTGIDAADFAKAFTVYTNSGSIQFSAAMIVRGIVKNSTNTNYQDLARAFYLYGVQAESFFA